MELNTITLSDFVALAQTIWIKALDSMDNFARESGLFNVIPISEHTGNTRQFSGVDSNEYLRLKTESDQAARGQVQQTANVTMTHRRFGENVGISYEMRTQNKYPEVVRRLTDGARKGPNSIDLDLSHRIGFGTATSYTDRDGVSISTTTSDGLSLFNTAHTLTGSSTTFRNRLAGNARVSKGALEGIERLAIENSFNELGEKVVVPLDILFSTDDPTDVNTIREYLRSVAAPDFANSGVTNVYKGKYKHVILPRVATDAVGAPDTAKRNNWGIASSMKSSGFLGIWEEPHLIAPTANSNAEDVQTDDWEFRVRTGYGIAIVNGNWIFFSTGDDSA